MRIYSFSFNNEKEYNEAGALFVEMFKDSDDYKKKKIIIGGAQDKDDTLKIFLSIDDDVNGIFGVTFTNAFNKTLKNVFFATKADCKDIHVELPANCKVLTWWEKEQKTEKE